VWDTGKVREPLVSVDDLRRPALHGRVVLPREWSDGLGLVALAQGHRVDGPAAAVGDALDQALGVVERLGRDGQLLAAGDPVEMLRQGRAAAGIARSADVQRLQAAAPGRFSFVVPDTGALLVTDDLVVPRGTDRRADVLRLLDHYLQPAVAAVVARTVPGLCPVPAARDVLATVDARRAASPLVFPTDADLARCQLLTVLDADAEARYADAYLTIAGPAHG
jgi:spermidine/putrescine transport system substrate-binding protein